MNTDGIKISFAIVSEEQRKKENMTETDVFNVQILIMSARVKEMYHCCSPCGAECLNTCCE